MLWMVSFMHGMVISGINFISACSAANCMFTLSGGVGPMGGNWLASGPWKTRLAFWDAWLYILLC